MGDEQKGLSALEADQREKWHPAKIAAAWAVEAYEEEAMKEVQALHDQMEAFAEVGGLPLLVCEAEEVRASRIKMAVELGDRPWHQAMALVSQQVMGDVAGQKSEEVVGCQEMDIVTMGEGGDSLKAVDDHIHRLREADDWAVVGSSYGFSSSCSRPQSARRCRSSIFLHFMPKI
ncbi:uncharacterized protein VTP21DRAFT_9772 [Calcarisporiella thermophila]|uniref:uncharacterized protein n=1 Tax=Calcarisporiella thermophila TaxID=911321 RepID=UPI0037427913